MAEEQTLVIAGASARAAAFSALRAGLRPWCVDLFADEDLKARCSVTRIEPKDYPHRLPELMAQAPPGPWMYTGGLENHPRLVETLARQRPLWGNRRGPLSLVRTPECLATLCLGSGTPYPGVRWTPPEPAESGRWLVKPLAASGGSGIRVWRGEPVSERKRAYFQRYIDGPSFAAIFLGRKVGSRMLGVTRQLVGEPWLHAAPFQYCGSIGPIKQLPPVADIRRVERMGDRLTAAAGLRGLFGVDFIESASLAWPVDVNPRYTASVEVLEYATGRAYLWWHRLAFEPDSPPPGPIYAAGPVVGKAIHFARESFNFPVVGPWMETLEAKAPVEIMPDFADIPAAGTLIKRGWPVLSFFARGDSVKEVERNLRRIAGELENKLYPATGTL